MQQIVTARKGCLGLKSLFCGPKRTEGILTLVGAHIPVMIIQIRMRLTFDLLFVAACRLDFPYFIYFLSQVSWFNPGIVFFCQLFCFRSFVPLCSLLHLLKKGIHGNLSVHLVWHSPVELISSDCACIHIWETKR